MSIPAGDLPTVFIGTFALVLCACSVFINQLGVSLLTALVSTRAREQELDQIRASLASQVAERTADLQATLAEVAARADAQGRLLAALDEQRETIRALSVPVLPVSATTLVLPLVGALDGSRLQLVQEQALRALEQARAQVLVLDITGVALVDRQVAQGLVAVMQAARLLGAEVVLVGIRPEVAQAIVGLGLDLTGVRTAATLQAGLAMRVMGRG